MDVEHNIESCSKLSNFTEQVASTNSHKINIWYELVII